MTWYVAVDTSPATYEVKSFLACALATTICIVPNFFLVAVIRTVPSLIPA